ncbi:chemotaxis regulatory protein ChePep [Helicobacter pylori]|uniref:chemotaxis regulatory protein ChePep n=1 Tax=Helicobacter pylori TaxID=210 RepID=UPI002738C805|nr:chemotaxis regulatory protein ChePep [Helicobacter pylori]
MKMILFNQNPMIAKLLESVSKKLELSIENFNHYQELSAHLKKDPEWLLIADDECLEKLDQVDWLELKEIISQNKNSVCMYKKGNEKQPFLEGFEMKIKKPFLPTEVLKILQKKLGSDMSELEPSQNLDPTQEVLETNWDELESLGDLEALAKEEPNNEEQLLPTLNDQEEKEEVKKEEKEEVKETPQEEEKPKDDETQESETPKDEEVSKELETQEELEIPKEETQEEVKEEIKEETQEIKEEKQEETQDSPSVQELEAMQELVKEIQENSNGQENKEKTQESAEIPQDKEIQEVVTEKTQAQELEIPKEKTQESTEALQETQAHELEKQEIAETPQEKEKQEDTETPQELEIPQAQEKETPQEETQEKETPQTQDETPQEDHYESIEDIPEPVMAKAMGEELPFLNESVAKIPNNENDTETPKESVTETSKNENATETPQEEESDKTSSPLELRLNLQDLLKSLNQDSLKSLLENKTLSIKITLEDKKPNA